MHLPHSKCFTAARAGGYQAAGRSPTIRAVTQQQEKEMAQVAGGPECDYQAGTQSHNMRLQGSTIVVTQSSSALFFWSLSCQALVKEGLGERIGIDLM